MTRNNGRANTEMPLRYTTVDTAFGALRVAYAGTTVRYTDVAVPEEEFEQGCLARIGTRPERTAQPPERLIRAIDSYLQGHGRYSGPVDLSTVSPLQEKALRTAMRIRPGEIRSYGWIAREIGVPGAARAVGTAMARNPIPILVPCHRVVRTDYHIGNYGAGGPDKKREILRHEGVDVASLERLARGGVRFAGSKTTRIFCLPGCYTGRRMKPENHVFFNSESQARAAGFRACKVCRPA
jgi:O-6-methylguanine DNA methyltransferase